MGREGTSSLKSYKLFIYLQEKLKALFATPSARIYNNHNSPKPYQ